VQAAGSHRASRRFLSYLCRFILLFRV